MQRMKNIWLRVSYDFNSHFFLETSAPLRLCVKIQTMSLLKDSYRLDLDLDVLGQT